MIKIFILLLLLPIVLAAQTDHSALLYSHMLDSNNATQFTEFTNRDGAFLAGKGWEASNNASQLYIKLPENLPDEGTLIINVTNFDPIAQNQDDKQQIINLYSQNNGSKEIFDSQGSWCNIRTGHPYSDGPGMAGFKFLAAAYGIDTRDEERCIQSKNDWDLNDVYEFKIVWTPENITCYLDNVPMSTLPFRGQIEPFQYIFIGTDNVYTAQPGPIYSNFRIFSSESAIAGAPVTFSNVTKNYKAEGYSGAGYGHGVSFADIDKDGNVDLFVSNATRDVALPDLLYMNQGGDWFSEQAEIRGIDDLGLTHSIVAGDIDNDGDIDAFFADMGVYEDGRDGFGRNELYRNDNGQFRDITNQGISDEDNETRGAIMLDINNDGLLDIYAVNWGQPCEMYLNQGGGVMKRVHQGADGPPDDASSKQGVTAADFDNDGDIDIYVCRREEGNWLFVNDGSGHFIEKADEYDVDVGGRSHGAAFADVDNDGDLDLFVINYAYTPGELPLMSVFINNGDGSFLNATKSYNIPISGYSISFGDVDNDGDLDMLLPYNNEKDPGAVPRLLVNNGAGIFYRASCGIEVPTKDPRGVAYGDIDNDGDIDFYIACKDGQNFLLQNDYDEGNHYIDIVCIGPRGDYGGFGSKVTVYEPGHLGDRTKILGYQESTSNYGYLSQNQTALHFGLREFTACDIRIVLTDGSTFNYTRVPANQIFEMDGEPEEQLTINYISGDNQSGEPGQELSEDFIVRVMNESGIGPAQADVTFTPQNGGSMLVSSMSTDADGYARSAFILGEAEGDYNIIASCNTAVGIVTFHARAEINHTTISIIKNYGDEQSGIVGQTLGTPVVVKAVDDKGRAVANINIEFAAQSGMIGSDSTRVATTDADGKARAIWTLGMQAGRQQLVARYGDIEQHFTATAFADAPAMLQKVAAAETTFQAGKSYPIKCAATDQYNNPTPGIAIHFSILSGRGTVEDDSSATVETDSSGIVGAIWRLGLNHTFANVLRAEIVDAGSIEPIEFIIPSPEPPLLDKSTITSNKNSVAADALDEAKIVIVLKDELGQPLPDYAVDINVDGTGAILEQLSDKSDDLGIYKAVLKSNSPGKKTIAASIPGVGDVPDIATILFTPPTPDKMYLVKVSGDSQAAVVAQTLPEPLVVRVINSEKTPLSGKKIVFEVKNNLGRVGEGWREIVTSNDGGFAEIELTLGERAGRWNHKVVAYLEDDSSGVAYRATALADTAAAITKISADSLTVMPGDTLALKVRVVDTYDNAIQHINVSFSSDGDDGFISEIPMLTNANGEASVDVIIGNKIANRRIRATFGTLSAYFTIFVVPEPEHLISISPDTIIFKDIISVIELKVQSLNSDGQPLPGIAVEFQLVQGPGEFTQAASVQSDSNGFAITAWRPASMLDITIIQATSMHDSLRFYLRPRLISSIEPRSQPGDFALLANYPNPFNPSTTIPFRLPREEFVKLQIFDVNGRLVRTLVEGGRNPGEHIAIFDAVDESGESLPSGIYFYQLEAGGYKEIKRLLLVK
jgi:enediyne biosynthesis protein E4